MEETENQITVPPIGFELLGLVLVFIAYLSVGGQNRLIPTPLYSPIFALAIVGIALCGWALVRRGKQIFERKQRGKRIFFDGVDAFLVSPLMLLIGGRLLKLEGSFCLMFGCSMEIPADLFNTLSWVLVLMALVTGGFGFISMFLESKA